MGMLFCKLPSWLQGQFTGKRILVLLVLTLALYGYMIFFSIPHVMSFAGGMKLLDMQPLGYTPVYARSLLEALGAEGRTAYLYRQIPVDMIYPGLFAVTFSQLLAWLFRVGLSEASRVNNLAVVPILAGLFDYAENVGIGTMLVIFPDFSESTAEVTCGFSVLKSLFTAIFFLALMATVVAVVRTKAQLSRA